ncbi:immunoglobulin-binding protein 1-like [Ostrea edulis]|uniref:immunoglobulin-binding protein 1-like n=1 Tax=Ostrea edulis TaxID=37623 RepID=UPI0024AE9323|nr:immunoglobulin-binding protein 1-like [Ostrea edulis]
MAQGGEERLPDLYETVWSCWETLNSTEEASSSYNVQKAIITGITSGVKAIKMVNELCLFSTNEELEEVATNEMKYLLLPAFMGFFTERKAVKKMEDREGLVKESKAYYIDFLRNCDCYGVAKIDERLLNLTPDSEQKAVVSNGAQGLPGMILSREEKIKSFKEKKELDAKVKELHERVKQEHVDDEVKREYYSGLLKQWIGDAKESLESLQMEVAMLGLRNQTLNEEPESKPKEQKKSFRPFIITKDMIQKTVFGAGYPSIPTVTIEEFYEQKVKDGTFQPPTSKGHSMQDWAKDPEKDKEAQEKEAEEKEQKIEQDDPEELQKTRAFDDWKDDHRRGWGNRKNMG